MTLFDKKGCQVNGLLGQCLQCWHQLTIASTAFTRYQQFYQLYHNLKIILWIWKHHTAAQGLYGDTETYASIPRIETSVQKSRAYIWVQRKKCNQKILLHVLQGLSLPHYAKAKYAFHLISSPLLVYRMIYIHFLQSPSDNYL